MMGSQFRSLRAVPNEIILRIVENMNTKTRESFMVTDKVYADPRSTSFYRKITHGDPREGGDKSVSNWVVAHLYTHKGLRTLHLQKTRSLLYSISPRKRSLVIRYRALYSIKGYVLDGSRA